MKKTNLVTRILSLVLILCLSFAMMTMDAFAVDDSNPGASSEIPGEPDRSVGAVLYSDSADLVNSTTISIYMSSGNWSTDFLVAITGNAGAVYEVDMTTPSGSTYSALVTSGTGYFTHIATMAYAGKGTYTFQIYRLTGSAVTAHALVEICD